MGARIEWAILTSLCAVLIATALTACRARRIAPILLFNGTGTSAGDVAALEKILSSAHLSYSTVNSTRLNGMSESQIRNMTCGWGTVVGKYPNGAPAIVEGKFGQRVGASYWGSSRSTGELEARNGVQHARQHKQCLCDDTDPRCPQSRVVTALLN